MRKVNKAGLDLIKYFEENNIYEGSYINKYIKHFIDGELNEFNDVKNNLNEILLYLNYISGTYYEDIKIYNKVQEKTSSNLKMLCEMKALSSF